LNICGCQKMQVPAGTGPLCTKEAMIATILLPYVKPLFTGGAHEGQAAQVGQERVTMLLLPLPVAALRAQAMQALPLWLIG
jgi:hypothetical protein